MVHRAINFYLVFVTMLGILFSCNTYFFGHMNLEMLHNLAADLFYTFIPPLTSNQHSSSQLNSPFKSSISVVILRLPFETMIPFEAGLHETVPGV